ncbi:MAG TPA: hypothetical protein VMW45_00565 [Dehalococcoidia bacterium]|nr:hypothetical protein [Dehalococcoidia bacterium]
MVTISNKAAERLREKLLHRCSETGIGFRLLASTDESDRVAFSMKVDRQDQRDKVIDLGGVKVFFDPSFTGQISEYQLDYRDEPDSGFFLKTYKEAKIG